MGYLYQLIKTMKEHHLIDETLHPVKDKHISPNDSMKALSDVESEILKSLSYDRPKQNQKKEALLTNKDK